MQGTRLVYLWEINKQLVRRTDFLHVTQESGWDRNKKPSVGIALAIISSCHHDARMSGESFYDFDYCKQRLSTRTVK